MKAHILDSNGARLLFAALFPLAFAVPTASATLTTLASFDGTNGANPHASLIADAAGNLYSTTLWGGANNKGTVFRLDAGTNALTTLTTFSGPNGANPYAGLIADAVGNLYGTTYGGSTHGTVFKLAKDTNTFTTLAKFGIGGDPAPSDCYAGLIFDAGGNLYGTTSGGGAEGNGTVFKVAASTNTVSTLASFSGHPINGSFPTASLIADASGNFYGTTFYGGASADGTVFKLAAGSNTITTLATFNVTNGDLPYAGLIADAAGNLYGTTESGGGGGRGTIFKLAAGTNALTTLVSFNNTNGDSPYSGLIADAAGNLFGTTSAGGANGLGTIFKLDVSTNTLTTLASFNGTNGRSPYASLIADAAGNLYGTTYLGGTSGQGTVFELSDTGFVAIPEPSSLCLACLAFLVLLALRRSVTAAP